MEKGYIEKLYWILRGGGYQRTLHYHNTPRDHEKLYEEQMKYIKEHYHTVSLAELENTFLRRQRGNQEEDGKKRKIQTEQDRQGKPEIVIGLFDGYRNNFDAMYPILEKYGQTAWFLLVADFLDTPAEQQEGKLEEYRMQYMLGEYNDRRYAMSWDEARLAARSHTIVNHSSTHFFMMPDTKKEALEYEICHSHELIVRNTGIVPRVFSWLGGGEFSTNREASKMLQVKGYEYLIGYELENIKPEAEKPDPGSKMAAELRIKAEENLADLQGRICDYPEEELEEEIRYHQKIMETIGIFSAVPAILPLYRAETPEIPKIPINNKEDISFAAHFYRLASYLRNHLRIPEWDAAHRALDIMAVNMIGEGFPFHLEK